MRITRVTKIRGHRVFRDFAWPKDLHCFGRLNVIYGWNGCGKTTLSSLFAHIEKRANLTEGELDFEIDNARTCAGSGIASTDLPPVRVFNRDFINATITATGQRFAPIYVLGEENSEKQAKADALKKAKEDVLERLTNETTRKALAESELDRFRIERAKLVKEVLTGSKSTRYGSYNKARFKDAVEAIRSHDDARAALLSAKDKENLRKQKDSQPRGDLPSITWAPPDFATLSIEARALLERSVASETLDALTQDKEVALWVQQGLRLHWGDRETSACRFCTQPLTEERRAALEGHFNDAFTRFEQELTSTIATLDRELDNLKQVVFFDSGRAYEHLQEELAAAISEAEEAVESTAAWVRELRNALDVKRTAPFSACDTGIWQVNASTRDVLPDTIAAVNALVGKHNSVTNDFHNMINEACTKLEQHYIAEAWEEHARLASAVRDADAALAPLKDEVDRLHTDIERTERDIIQHRKPADELNRELRAYLGRDELRFDVKETGYALTRAGKSVNHLSEGERTAIAFLYFLKSLSDRAFDFENGVVVIDDPVSSLDANALFSAFGYMKGRTEACGQLFVMTHNFGFFRQVKNWFHVVNRKSKKDPGAPIARFFMLKTLDDQRNGRSAEICPIDPLLRDYDSEYHYLFKCVWESASDNNGNVALRDLYSMPNVARRLLEAFLAFRYPEHRGDGALHALLKQVNLDDARKSRVLRFVHTYSHSDHIQDVEEEPWAFAETSGVLTDILNLIQQEDPSHYAGMLKRVGDTEAIP